MTTRRERLDPAPRERLDPTPSRRERLDPTSYPKRFREGTVKDAAPDNEVEVEGKREVEAPRRTFPQPAQGGAILSVGTGRPPGSLNYITRQLKNGLLDAATQVGFDGKGQDGLTGYLRRLALMDTSTFGSLLRRILPVQLKAELDADGLLAKLIGTAEATLSVRRGGPPPIDVTPTASWRSNGDGR